MNLIGSSLFDNITLGIISLNALWISIDADHNKVDRVRLAQPEHRRKKADCVDTPVYRREDLACHQVIKGPAVVEQLDSTLLVFPGDNGHVDNWGNLVISVAEEVGS